MTMSSRRRQLLQILVPVGLAIFFASALAAAFALAYGPARQEMHDWKVNCIKQAGQLTNEAGILVCRYPNGSIETR